MKKAATLALATVLLVSAGSAAMIPGNITIDLNVNLFGGDEQQQEKEEEKENTTYGDRVNGQAVHTDTRSNDPEVQRNSDEFGVTEEDTNEKNDLAEMFNAFVYNLMGKEGGPDTSTPNSVE
jgi:hypothetical protein